MENRQTSSSELYREKARNLRKQAAEAATPNLRMTLEALAHGWDQMAMRFSLH